MQLNTQLNRELGCPLSLHRHQIDPLGISAEVVDFGHETLGN
jgi:hypothetical protein